MIRHVFVIAFENRDAIALYGNVEDAPYINATLLPNYAHATNFNDELPEMQSEPHYIWMEAGTNEFDDHDFRRNKPPSDSNSTGSTAHLVTQIKNARHGVSWRSYQEGLNSTTGACPVTSNGLYNPKHNPFVFFKDVAGDPPSATNAYCASHHRPYSGFSGDLAANDVASYTFITPDLCNDMHGASGCPDPNAIRAGDKWLSTELPRVIDWVNANSGVIFLTWDEGAETNQMPFLAIGPGAKPGFASSVFFDHSSQLKSIELILDLPVLPSVRAATPLTDMFKPGSFP